MVLRNTPSAKKMAESEDMIDVCDDLGIESFFFEHVLNRTEEILDEHSIVSSEHRISTLVPSSPPGCCTCKGVVLLNKYKPFAFLPLSLLTDNV